MSERHDKNGTILDRFVKCKTTYKGRTIYGQIIAFLGPEGPSCHFNFIRDDGARCDIAIETKLLEAIGDDEFALEIKSLVGESRFADVMARMRR